MESTQTRGEAGRAAIAAKRSTTGAGKRKATESNAPTNKRQRTGTNKAGESYTHAFVLNVPDACGPWVLNALNLLATRDLGSQWRELVAAWLTFEATTDFVEHGGQLPAKHRPPIVGGWIKRACDPDCLTTSNLTIGDIPTFVNSFNAWWRSFQPKWRLAGAGSELTRSGGDWATLCRYTGVNGLLSVLACLYFWRSGTLTPDEHAAWDDAVDDVLFVVQQLAAQS